MSKNHQSVPAHNYNESEGDKRFALGIDCDGMVTVFEWEGVEWMDSLNVAVYLDGPAQRARPNKDGVNGYVSADAAEGAGLPFNRFVTKVLGAGAPIYGPAVLTHGRETRDGEGLFEWEAKLISALFHMMFHDESLTTPEPTAGRSASRKRGSSGR